MTSSMRSWRTVAWTSMVSMCSRSSWRHNGGRSRVTLRRVKTAVTSMHTAAVRDFAALTTAASAGKSHARVPPHPTLIANTPPCCSHWNRYQGSDHDLLCCYAVGIYRAQLAFRACKYMSEQRATDGNATCPRSPDCECSAWKTKGQQEAFFAVLPRRLKLLHIRSHTDEHAPRPCEGHNVGHARS